MESQFELYHLWKGLKAKCWIYLIAKKALFLFNWINASHNNVVKMMSDWRIQYPTVPHLKFLELPLHGTLSKRFVLMYHKCSKNTDFVIANTPTGDYVEMKNSVEDAFCHLTPGQESRAAAIMCYAAHEKKDRLSTFETAPGTRKK